MSVTHSWFGPLRAKVRSTRSVAMLSGRIRFHFRRPVIPCRPAPAHQQLDLVVADLDAAAEGQLGVDPAGAVDAVGLGVDLGDEVGQQGVTDCSFGRRPRALLVEPGLRDPEDLARDSHGTVLRGDHFDRRVPPFGLASSFNRSTAR
jgi:hypothetical protein